MKPEIKRFKLVSPEEFLADSNEPTTAEEIYNHLRIELIPLDKIDELKDIQDFQIFFKEANDKINRRLPDLFKFEKIEILKDLRDWYMELTILGKVNSSEDSDFLIEYFEEQGIYKVDDIDAKFDFFNLNDLIIDYWIGGGTNNVYTLNYGFHHKLLFEFREYEYTNGGIIFKTNYELDANQQFNIEDLMSNPEILLEKDQKYQREKKIDMLLSL